MNAAEERILLVTFPDDGAPPDQPVPPGATIRVEFEEMDRAEYERRKQARQPQ